MRRAPAGRSITSPASFSTFRCCETAGRLTGSSRASSPTAHGRSARRSKIARLVGSPSAVSPFVWLVIAYGKYKLTRSPVKFAAVLDSAETGRLVRAPPPADSAGSRWTRPKRGRNPASVLNGPCVTDLQNRKTGVARRWVGSTPPPLRSTSLRSRSLGDVASAEKPRREHEEDGAVQGQNEQCLACVDER